MHAIVETIARRASTDSSEGSYEDKMRDSFCTRIITGSLKIPSKESEANKEQSQKRGETKQLSGWGSV